MSKLAADAIPPWSAAVSACRAALWSLLCYRESHVSAGDEGGRIAGDTGKSGGRIAGNTGKSGRVAGGADDEGDRVAGGGRRRAPSVGLVAVPPIRPGGG